MTAPRNCLLIVTSLFEPNVNHVVKRLDELGIRWFRFNTESFPLLCRGRLHFKDDDGPHLELALNGRTIDSRDITGVWYRRQSEPVLAEGLADHDREFTRLECLGFLSSLYRCLEHCRWVNPWLAERQAADKMMQLSVARTVGLRIPRTLVTNDPRAVREFSTGCPGRVVFKPLIGLVTGRPPDYSAQLRTAFAGKFSFAPACREEPAGQERRLVFTQVLTQDKLAEIDAIAACPAIFQEYVDKQVELRITIVGDKVFSAAIHSQEHPETRVDFRRLALLPAAKVKHTVFDLPAEIRAKLLALMQKLGLVFGCVDMILTPAGDYVFLEVNASGQWGWIEQITGMPITAALVELLTIDN
jgi:hypothetical protein